MRAPLLVYGVHGDEGRRLEGVVRRYVPRGFEVVKLFDDVRYVSTLDPRYYLSELGERWVRLVVSKDFDAYVELHAYRPWSYRRLVVPRGKVPGLVDLGEGVLLGSVPRGKAVVLGPVLALTVEVPDGYRGSVLKELLEGVLRAEGGWDFASWLVNRFGEAGEEALIRFFRYSMGSRDPF